MIPIPKKYTVHYFIILVIEDTNLALVQLSYRKQKVCLFNFQDCCCCHVHYILLKRKKNPMSK